MKGEEKVWNPKGGRPKKEGNDKKDGWINIRVTADEKEGFNKEAERAGYKRATDYARKKLFANENESLYNPRPLLLAINKLSGEINKIGVNINQIAKYVNYLDKNNVIDPKFLADYNIHFRKMMELKSEFLVAIRAYLRSNKKH